MKPSTLQALSREKDPGAVDILSKSSQLQASKVSLLTDLLNTVLIYTMLYLHPVAGKRLQEIYPLPIATPYQ